MTTPSNDYYRGPKQLLASAKAEAGRLRAENAALRSELARAIRRGDYMHDKLVLHERERVDHWKEGHTAGLLKMKTQIVNWLNAAIGTHVARALANDIERGEPSKQDEDGTYG